MSSKDCPACNCRGQCPSVSCPRQGCVCPEPKCPGVGPEIKEQINQLPAMSQMLDQLLYLVNTTSVAGVTDAIHQMTILSYFRHSLVSIYVDVVRANYKHMTKNNRAKPQSPTNYGCLFRLINLNFLFFV